MKLKIRIFDVRNLLPTVCLAIMGALCSCGEVNADDTIRQAENDLLTGNIQMAADGCALLSDSATVLTSPQMCQVALLYAKLSEASDNQDYMASATECYERAVALDAQTADGALDTYIESLSVEDQGLVRVIRQVAQALNSPCDISDDEGEEMESVNRSRVLPVDLSHTLIASL